eukprot:g1141.t1
MMSSLDTKRLQELRNKYTNANVLKPAHNMEGNKVESRVLMDALMSSLESETATTQAPANYEPFETPRYRGGRGSERGDTEGYFTSHQVHLNGKRRRLLPYVPSFKNSCIVVKVENTVWKYSQLTSDNFRFLLTLRTPDGLTIASTTSEELSVSSSPDGDLQTIGNDIVETKQQGTFLFPTAKLDNINKITGGNFDSVETLLQQIGEDDGPSSAINMASAPTSQRNIVLILPYDGIFDSVQSTAAEIPENVTIELEIISNAIGENVERSSFAKCVINATLFQVDNRNVLLQTHEGEEGENRLQIVPSKWTTVECSPTLWKASCSFATSKLFLPFWRRQQKSDNDTASSMSSEIDEDDESSRVSGKPSGYSSDLETYSSIVRHFRDLQSIIAIPENRLALVDILEHGERNVLSLLARCRVDALGSVPNGMTILRELSHLYDIALQQKARNYELMSLSDMLYNYFSKLLFYGGELDSKRLYNIRNVVEKGMSLRLILFFMKYLENFSSAGQLSFQLRIRKATSVCIFSFFVTNNFVDGIIKKNTNGNSTRLNSNLRGKEDIVSHMTHERLLHVALDLILRSIQEIASSDDDDIQCLLPVSNRLSMALSMFGNTNLTTRYSLSIVANIVSILSHFIALHTSEIQETEKVDEVLDYHMIVLAHLLQEEGLKAIIFRSLNEFISNILRGATGAAVHPTVLLRLNASAIILNQCSKEINERSQYQFASYELIHDILEAFQYHEVVINKKSHESFVPYGISCRILFNVLEKKELSLTMSACLRFIQSHPGFPEIIYTSGHNFILQRFSNELELKSKKGVENFSQSFEAMISFLKVAVVSTKQPSQVHYRFISFILNRLLASLKNQIDDEIPSKTIALLMKFILELFEMSSPSRSSSDAKGDDAVSMYYMGTHMSRSRDILDIFEISTELLGSHVAARESIYSALMNWVLGGKQNIATMLMSEIAIMEGVPHTLKQTSLSFYRNTLSICSAFNDHQNTFAVFKNNILENFHSLLLTSQDFPEINLKVLEKLQQHYRERSMTRFALRVRATIMSREIDNHDSTTELRPVVVNLVKELVGAQEIEQARKLLSLFKMDHSSNILIKEQLPRIFSCIDQAETFETSCSHLLIEVNHELEISPQSNVYLRRPISEGQSIEECLHEMNQLEHIRFDTFVHHLRHEYDTREMRSRGIKKLYPIFQPREKSSAFVFFLENYKGNFEFLKNGLAISKEDYENSTAFDHVLRYQKVIRVECKTMESWLGSLFPRQELSIGTTTSISSADACIEFLNIFQARIDFFDIIAARFLIQQKQNNSVATAPIINIVMALQYFLSPILNRVINVKLAKTLRSHYLEWMDLASKKLRTKERRKFFQRCAKDPSLKKNVPNFRKMRAPEHRSLEKLTKMIDRFDASFVSILSKLHTICLKSNDIHLKKLYWDLTTKTKRDN